MQGGKSFTASALLSLSLGPCCDCREKRCWKPGQCCLQVGNLDGGQPPLGLLAFLGRDEVVGVADAQDDVVEGAGDGGVDLLVVSDDRLADWVAVVQAEHADPVLACLGGEGGGRERDSKVKGMTDRHTQYSDK